MEEGVYVGISDFAVKVDKEVELGLTAGNTAVAIIVVGVVDGS